MTDFTLPVPRPSELTEGKDAVAESAALTAGVNLDDRAALNRLNNLLRADSREQHIHRILIGAIWIFSALVLVMFGALCLNLVLPDAARFLTAAEMQTLQQFLFSGFVGGALTSVGSRLKKDGP